MSANELEGSVKLSKFTFDYVDATGANRQYCQESKSDVLRKVKLPFGFNRMDPDELLITMETANNNVPTKIDDFDFFKFLALNTENIGDYEDKKRKDLILKDLPQEEYFEPDDDENKEFPKMTYSDVTEKDMFGYAPMSATDLLPNNGKGGIWGMHGLRKFEITIEGLPISESEDFNEIANLYWYRRDSEEIAKIYETDIRLRLQSSTEDKRVYVAYINTNRLGKSAAEAESKYPEFLGRFEIHHEYMDEIRSYTFPIQICVHDTTIDKSGKNHLLDGKMVSIDFGTSSTCAAIQIGKLSKLFTLSGPAKRSENEDNPFENPTNLMIYNWDEIFNQWQMDNENCPFMLSRSEEHDEKEADYDSGYTVDDEYKSVGEETGRRKMAAILTQLKLIPYFKAKDNRYEPKVTPYSGKTRTKIIITDSLERSENSKQKFNAIAFYGYLLSRAINNPKNGAFYRNYRITYPVKFNKDIREKIRSSLEYGIMRALPKSVRKAVNKKGDPLVSVRMEYAEPVASVGAIVSKQLKITKEDPSAKLFAIYDLGGGTLDFAFGMFRSAVGDEVEEADQVIDILGIDGDDKVGGEKFIHKLAYKIYKDNIEEVKTNKIPFVLPVGELPPEGFEGTELLSDHGDDNSNTNVNLLKEKLTRFLFKYTGGIDGNLTQLQDESVLVDDGDNKVTDATHYTLSMRDENGEDKPINLEVNGIDDFLQDEIRSTIESFKSSMDRFFTENIDRIRETGDINNYRPDDVYIFLSGNASRQHYVKEIMDEIFSSNAAQNRIARIGENSNDTGESLSKEYKLTEKTAVAFGQLELGKYIVYQDAISVGDEIPPFLFNVGYYDSGDDTNFICVLKTNTNSRSWEKANRIDKENLTANLVYTTDPQCDPKSMEKLEEDVSDAVEGRARTLYIRIYEEDSIEYRVGGANEPPDDDELVDESKIIKLRITKN